MNVCTYQAISMNIRNISSVILEAITMPLSSASGDDIGVVVLASTIWGVQMWRKAQRRCFPRDTSRSPVTSQVFCFVSSRTSAVRAVLLLRPMRRCVFQKKGALLDSKQCEISQILLRIIHTYRQPYHTFSSESSLSPRKPAHKNISLYGTPWHLR